MHAKSGLRVVLKWKIYRPDSVITAVIQPMRFSIRTLLIFTVLCSFVLGGLLWYLRYQAWANELHLAPIAARLRNNSSTITHPAASHFVIDPSKPSDQYWLELNVQYFSHAGRSGGYDWGYNASPKISTTNDTFTYELHNGSIPWPPSVAGPQVVIDVEHSKIDSRTSKLSVNAKLVDTTGETLDTRTDSFTFTDTPDSDEAG